jgi:hypothetical protein
MLELENVTKYRVKIERVDEDGVSIEVEKSEGHAWVSSVLPVSAVVISIASLAFTHYQTKEAEKHDRLSLVPFLQLSGFGRIESNFGIFIENE